MAAMNGPERRRAARVSPDASPWKAEAVLRPGLQVRLINVGPLGALVESPARLRPGRRAELQLLAAASDLRHTVSGRIERCQVIRLSPLCFRGAIEFDPGTCPDEVVGVRVVDTRNG